MKLIAILFIGCATLTLKSQEVFTISGNTFAINCPVNWPVIATKDQSNIRGGNSNVVYQSIRTDECRNAFMGVQIINTTKAPISSKNNKGKEIESSAAYQKIASFQCFYYSGTFKNKKKCGTVKHYSSYSHRINDSLDVVIYLSSVAIESELNQLDSNLRLLADSFFIKNKLVLQSLKPEYSFKGKDSILVFGKGFLFPMLRNWALIKKYDEFDDDPTGKRAVIQQNAKSYPIPCSIEITVADYSITKGQEATYILSSKSRYPKKGERPAFAVRADSIKHLVELNGYDTTSLYGVVEKTVDDEDKLYYAYYHSYYFMTKQGLYRVTLEFTAPLADPLSASFAGEEFESYCIKVLRMNNFRKWSAQ